MTPFDFHIPTRILFGRGRIAELGRHLPAGTERVFIVTDETIATRTEALTMVQKALEGCTLRTFTGVEENPSLALVEEGGRQARAFDAQLILALGGGSPMDAAKGMAMLATNPGRLADYLGGAPLPCAPTPVVAVPTTSGTGSEVTPYAVFTDPDAGSKIGFGHPGIFPVLALVDPELTRSMPSSVVINTGLDVLAHAVEAFLSTLSFPLNDVLALHALDATLAWLGRAAQQDPEAMDQMAAAATVAGAAITHASTILPHIMGYPLTVFHGVPHGRASAIMLAHVLAELGIASTCPGKVQLIENRFASCGGLEGFLHGLGVSLSLADYGVREEELPLYARKTIVKGDVQITPTAVTLESLERIYRSAL